MHPGAATYGEAFADVYDDWYSDVSDVAATVEALVDLADGPVLELGVGTGRLALPLAARGIEVHGVDASASMLDRLRAKDPTGRVVTHLSDMATGLPEGPWAAAFIAYNTFFNLDTETRQRQCLRNVGRVLRPGGHLVIEAFIPSTGPLPRRSASVRARSGGGHVLSVSVIDAAAQVVRGSFVELTEDGARYRPWSIRYLSPHQLDDMAAAEGLALVHRWGDWDRRPYGATERHVSVYRSTARRETGC